MIVKDHNLVKWTGGNSYRTSHYPYSEEIMDLTDDLGIVIIDEISAVAIRLGLIKVIISACNEIFIKERSFTESTIFRRSASFIFYD